MGLFDFFKRKPAKESMKEEEKEKYSVFFSPIKGKVSMLSDTPDEAFSKKMMGDGVVIFPEENKVFAPADCDVVFVFPTKHAIGLKTDQNAEFVIHVGINTVSLGGEGFKVFVSDGQKVKKGDLLMEFDMEYLKNNASSLATPFIITNLEDNQSVKNIKLGDVTNTDIIFEV